MSEKALGNLDLIRRVGLALGGCGSVIFFCWLGGYVIMHNTSIQVRYVEDLVTVGMIYVAASFCVGVAFGFFYLRLLLDNYAKGVPEPLQKKFYHAALCLFGNIPLAFVYFCVVVGLSITGGD